LRKSCCFCSDDVLDYFVNKLLGFFLKQRTKLLLIEDDPIARKRLLAILDHSLYNIETAASLFEAKESFDWLQPHLILLDIKLPDGSGFSFAKKLQKRIDVGLIIITSQDQTADKLKGLNLGADDYLIKPVNPQELQLKLARLNERVNITKRLNPSGGGQYRFDGWTLEMENGTLTDKTGQPCPLTNKEFEILRIMVQNPQIALSRDRILVLAGRGDQDIFDRVVDSIITRLRKKIEPDPKQPSIIKTVFGKGYMFCPDVKRA
jgi:two-component system, OmpR family, response regulator